MSVRDVHWTPADGGPGRDVPACSACAHKVDQGIEPDMRKVEVDGAPVSYVNAGFAPAYWGGFGLGPGLFTGFLLGQALTLSGDGYYSGDRDPAARTRGDFGGGISGRRFRRRRLGGGDFWQLPGLCPACTFHLATPRGSPNDWRPQHRYAGPGWRGPGRASAGSAPGCRAGGLEDLRLRGAGQGRGVLR